MGVLKVRLGALDWEVARAGLPTPPTPAATPLPRLE